MSNLPEKYNHKEAEKKWQKYWQEKQVYKWESNFPREQTFVIDTPPPTVSGLLHTGQYFFLYSSRFCGALSKNVRQNRFLSNGF
jgi:valyl-tRNA synthetase